MSEDSIITSGISQWTETSTTWEHLLVRTLHALYYYCQLLFAGDLSLSLYFSEFIFAVSYYHQQSLSLNLSQFSVISMFVDESVLHPKVIS